MRLFTREGGGGCVCFDLVIYKFVSGPLGFARAVPEADIVPTIFAEECFDSGC